MAAVILLFGRLALAAIFVPSGFGKFTRPCASRNPWWRGDFRDRLLGGIGACVEFFGALCVVLGLKTRYAALVMAVFTAIAALIAHQFWQLEGAARTAQHIQFMKNLAIIGGFLYLFAAGPGPFSLDRRGR